MKAQLLFLLPLLLVTACGVSEENKNATSTAYYATSDAIKEGWAQTEAAKPPPTPSNTRTPDTRTSSEIAWDKCKNGSEVRYIIEGNGVTGVSLTWENDTGGTNQGDYKVPYCGRFFDFTSGDFLYISAQIIRGEGSITCEILDGKTSIAKASASGFANIATCSGHAE